jgi:hypothetical protein
MAAVVSKCLDVDIRALQLTQRSGGADDLVYVDPMLYHLGPDLLK